MAERKPFDKAHGRDYIYDTKYESSSKRKRYRAALNRYNRKHGVYGNNDGKDASHKEGKIAGYEPAKINRGRREKSRLRGSKRRHYIK